MKRPLTALLFAQKYHMDLMDGDKTITIRNGHKDYQAGDTVMLCCHITQFCELGKIKSVDHTRIKWLTPNELEDDAFSSHDHAVTELKRYYIGINLNSEVTVIRFELQ